MLNTMLIKLQVLHNEESLSSSHTPNMLPTKLESHLPFSFDELGVCVYVCVCEYLELIECVEFYQFAAIRDRY